MSEPNGSRTWVGWLDERFATVHVVLTLLVLEVLTYWSYFVGLTVVNGDVNAHYMSDAYYWWNNGGILRPPEWIPYAWMGRPAGSNLQDGSYVLVQGLANAVAPWSPTVSAVTAALMTAFGALGMYLLVKRLFNNHAAALLAMVGQFYAPSLFAQAQFLDMQRGAAFLPWLLLLASPLWFWDRRWGLPVGALLLWQIGVGIYPGQIIGAVVCVGAWMLVWVVRGWRTAWGWVWRLGMVGVVAASLAVVKLAPALQGGTGQRDWEPQRLLLSPSILASIFFPYDNPAMPWDIAVRPFFIVVPILILVLLAPWRSSTMAPVMALGLSAATLILMVQFAPQALSSVPGMDLSRFQISDFRVFLVAAVLLGGAAGMRRLMRGEVTRARAIVASGVVLASAALLSLTLVWSGGVLRILGLLLPFVVIVAAASVIVWASGRRASEHLSRAGLSLMIVAVVSGLGFAYTVTSPWASPKERVERAHYGAEFSDVLSERDCVPSGNRRPERTRPSTAPANYWHDNTALVAAYDCSLAVSGYVNIPGNPVLRDQAQAFIGDDSVDLLRFFTAPGAMSPRASQSAAPPLDLSDACLLDGVCEGLSYKPVAYDPNGRFEYEVHAEKPTEVLLNESFYDGWEGEYCDTQGSCMTVNVRSGHAHALSVSVPEGSGLLSLEYHVPHLRQLRLLFVGALFSTLLLLLITPRSLAVARGSRSEER